MLEKQNFMSSQFFFGWRMKKNKKVEGHDQVVFLFGLDHVFYNWREYTSKMIPWFVYKIFEDAVHGSRRYSWGPRKLVRTFKVIKKVKYIY